MSTRDEARRDLAPASGSNTMGGEIFTVIVTHYTTLRNGARIVDTRTEKNHQPFNAKE